MSKRRDLETRIGSLREIEEIMNAMKNLSLMEVHRLTRFLDSQRRVVASIESMAADLLHFYPHLFRSEEKSRDICVLFGSERGFCGDFNESLLSAFEKHQTAVREGSVIVVGGKLASILKDDRRIAAFLEGVSVVEEVETVLLKLMDTLSGLNEARDATFPLRLTALHHREDKDSVQVSVLQPFKQPWPEATPFAYAPHLNLNPHFFLTGLGEQYLFAALHELLYSSLMAENQRRMQHMDSAIRRLERTSEELLLKRNILRQEEITEEIEIIMLSVEALL